MVILKPAGRGLRRAVTEMCLISRRGVEAVRRHRSRKDEFSQPFPETIYGRNNNVRTVQSVLFGLTEQLLDMEELETKQAPLLVHLAVASLSLKARVGICVATQRSCRATPTAPLVPQGLQP
jgi:hypothetical protein